jgi:vacuolar-type H+-ATPase subunit H
VRVQSLPPERKIRDRIREISDKKGPGARKKALEIIEKVEGTAAVARARKVRDELKKRTGSWANEAVANAQRVRESLTRKVEEGKKKGRAGSRYCCRALVPSSPR